MKKYTMVLVVVIITFCGAILVQNRLLKEQEVWLRLNYLAGKDNPIEYTKTEAQRFLSDTVLNQAVYKLNQNRVMLTNGDLRKMIKVAVDKQFPTVVKLKIKIKSEEKADEIRNVLVESFKLEVAKWLTQRLQLKNNVYEKEIHKLVLEKKELVDRGEDGNAKQITFIDQRLNEITRDLKTQVDEIKDGSIVDVIAVRNGKGIAPERGQGRGVRKGVTQ